MNDMTAIAGLGHNQPPGPFLPENLAAKIADFSDAAGAWLDLKAFANEEQSQKAADFIKGGKEVEKLVDAERKTQKQPHDVAAKAVQDFFAPKISTIKIAHERVSMMQTKWLQSERERKERERKEQEAAARAAEAEIERQRLAAEARNDVAGMAEAEVAAKAAAKEVKAAAKPIAARATSATGAGRSMGLRTYWFAEVQNINHAFVAYRDNPEVRQLLERLATADVRAQQGEKVAPQGFTIRKEEKAQ